MSYLAEPHYINFPEVHEVGVFDHPALPLTEVEVLRVLDMLNIPEIPIAVRAAYRYNNKSHESFDDLVGGPRRHKFAAPDDDLIVQVTIALNGGMHGGPIKESRDAMEAVGARVRASHAAASLAEAEAEVARKTDELAAAQNALEAARAARNG